MTTNTPMPKGTVAAGVGSIIVAIGGITFAITPTGASNHSDSVALLIAAIIAPLMGNFATYLKSKEAANKADSAVAVVKNGINTRLDKNTNLLENLSRLADLVEGRAAPATVSVETALLTLAKELKVTWPNPPVGTTVIDVPAPTPVETAQEQVPDTNSNSLPTLNPPPTADPVLPDKDADPQPKHLAP